MLHFACFARNLNLQVHFTQVLNLVRSYVSLYVVKSDYTVVSYSAIFFFFNSRSQKLREVCVVDTYIYPMCIDWLNTCTLTHGYLQ